MFMEGLSVKLLVFFLFLLLSWDSLLDFSPLSVFLDLLPVSFAIKLQLQLAGHPVRWKFTMVCSHYWMICSRMKFSSSEVLCVAFSWISSSSRFISYWSCPCFLRLEMLTCQVCQMTGSRIVSCLAFLMLSSLWWKRRRILFSFRLSWEQGIRGRSPLSRSWSTASWVRHY